jgi:hypothetical protein
MNHEHYTRVAYLGPQCRRCHDHATLRQPFLQSFRVVRAARVEESIIELPNELFAVCLQSTVRNYALAAL